MLKLKESNGFIYSDIEHSKQFIDTLTTMYTSQIIHLYSKRLPTVTISPMSVVGKTDDLKADATALCQVRHIYRRRFPEITQGYRAKLTGKLGKKLSYIGDDISIVVFFDTLDNYVENSPIILTVTIFGGENGYVQTESFVISDKNVQDLGPFIASRKRSRSEWLFSETHKNPEVRRLALRVLRSSLEQFRYQRDTIVNEPLTFQHSQTELYFIKRFLRAVPDPNGDRLITISMLNMIPEGMLLDDENKASLGPIEPSLNPLKDYHRSDWDNIPFFDLTTREWKFISNFISSRSDDNHPINQLPSLTPVFKSPRYGNRFSFLYDDSFGEERDINLEVHTEADGDRGKIIVRHSTNSGDHTVYLLIHLHRLEETNCDSIIRRIETIVTVNDDQTIVPDEDKLRGKFPGFFFSRDGITQLFSTVVSLLLTVYIRPERTRMIRETTSATKRKHVAGDKNGEDERHYIVRHILKPISDAREYIRQSSPSGEIHREYVTPEWERSGHERRLKSGRIIHVEAAICKRQLPLSEKEVHIKL